MIYPCVLIVIVFALFVFLITFVVPSFASLYEQMGSHLPAITTYLLEFGRLAQSKGIYVLLALAAAGYGLTRYTKTTKGRDLLDRVRIRMPIFGAIWIKYQVALFGRTLSTLLSGGLPLVPSLETAARSISSHRIAVAVTAAVVRVREGKSLAASLEGTKIFPGVATEMISVGEQTGALPAMLNSVSEFFEEDVETALTASMALIEPAILLVMGGVVVIILIALYLPIFSLGQIQQMQ